MVVESPSRNSEAERVLTTFYFFGKWNFSFRAKCLLIDKSVYRTKNLAPGHNRQTFGKQFCEKFPHGKLNPTNIPKPTHNGHPLLMKSHKLNRTSAPQGH